MFDPFVVHWDVPAGPAGPCGPVNVAVVCAVPSPNTIPPSNFAAPATSNFWLGKGVPIPTLPVDVILSLSVTALVGAPGILVQKVR